ncbi:dihydrodipicolinate synthase family protein [uncultured Microbacterium sp.]|uniref:dihydrodipicolinate synthase family protein n=1 Tax=uncultured Microbacterium sp. TaxID=191216 RepID=UPI0035CA616D
MRFTGVFAPLVSPLAADGRLKLGDVKKQMNYVRPWVHGFAPAIGCGEGWLLKFDDWRALLDCVVAEALGMPVIAGCNAQSWDELSARVSYAATSGATAVMVALPTGLGEECSHEEVLRRFSGLRRTVEATMLFYWEQFISGRSLTAGQCAEICDVLNAVAVKDSMHSPAATRELRDLRERVVILQGWEDLLGIELPVDGYIGPLALLSGLPRRCFDQSAGWDGVGEEAKAFGLLGSDYVVLVKSELRRRGVLSGHVSHTVLR